MYNGGEKSFLKGGIVIKKEEKPIISIRHIRKVYRMGDERIVALDDISLDIYKGEIVCFLGKSGSGKSTFLNMVAGLEKPTRGEILFGNIHIEKLSEEQVTLFRQKNIGFIFQAYNLLPMLTALENVEYPLVLRGMNRKKREKRAKLALDEVGLKGLENRKPNQMSGGQQQRVGIARAIAVDPKIIFADEPTGNLDTKTTESVMNLIIERVHRNNQTMILVTHDNGIAQYADRIITIQDGNIINIQNREDFDPSLDIAVVESAHDLKKLEEHAESESNEGVENNRENESGQVAESNEDNKSQQGAESERDDKDESADNNQKVETDEITENSKSMKNS